MHDTFLKLGRDCNSCIAEFSKIIDGRGGCDCLKDEFCDHTKLVPDDCFHCGAEGRKYCNSILGNVVLLFHLLLFKHNFNLRFKECNHNVITFYQTARAVDDNDSGLNDDPSLLVETSSGNVSGVNLDNNVQAWLGIPYAEPPLGNNRLKFFSRKGVISYDFRSI